VFCLVALGLEGFCAGGDIRQRLGELRTPPHVPPLWGWILIGIFYYVMCFAVLHRLFLIASAVPLRNDALVLMASLMLINANWNYFFFRNRNLFRAFLIGLPYSGIGVLLFVVLVFRLDRIAGWFLFPYLIYLFYANLWGYRTWKLNLPAQSD
jgi:tryptophan-rich sensory protein